MCCSFSSTVDLQHSIVKTTVKKSTSDVTTSRRYPQLVRYRKYFSGLFSVNISTSSKNQIKCQSIQNNVQNKNAQGPHRCNKCKMKLMRQITLPVIYSVLVIYFDLYKWALTYHILVLFEHCVGFELSPKIKMRKAYSHQFR